MSQTTKNKDTQRGKLFSRAFQNSVFGDENDSTSSP